MSEERREESPHRVPRNLHIDVLRGIAILLVVIYHSHVVIKGRYPAAIQPIVDFGWSGVDLFFVLSGFLVGGLLFKEFLKRGEIDSKRFLIRRAWKIWPQYYVFIFYSALLSANANRSLSDFFWQNMTHMQNYFGTILGHTWSLAVEEHFYLGFAFLVYIAAKLWRAKLSDRIFYALFALWAAVVAARLISLGLGVSGWDVRIHTHTTMDGLIVGVLIAAAYTFRREWFDKLPLWPFFGAFAGAIVARSFFNQNFESPLGPTLLQLIYASMLVICLKAGETKAMRWLSKRALYRFVGWVGIYSYGIYLWHMAATTKPVAFFERKLQFDSLPQPAREWATFGLYATGAIVSGALISKLVEMPMLKLRDKLYPSRVDTVSQPDAETVQPEPEPIPATT